MLQMVEKIPIPNLENLLFSTTTEKHERESHNVAETTAPTKCTYHLYFTWQFSTKPTFKRRNFDNFAVGLTVRAGL